MYEHACAAQQMATSQIKDMVGSFNYEITKTPSKNQDLITYIDSVKKECAAYMEQKPAYSKNVKTITDNRNIVIPQEKITSK